VPVEESPSVSSTWRSRIPIRPRLYRMGQLNPPDFDSCGSYGAPLLLPRQAENDRTSVSHQLNREPLSGCDAPKARTHLGGEVTCPHLGQGSPGLKDIE
jgi:hypothetical protein